MPLLGLAQLLKHEEMKKIKKTLKKKKETRNKLTDVHVQNYFFPIMLYLIIPVVN